MLLLIAAVVGLGLIAYGVLTQFPLLRSPMGARATRAPAAPVQALSAPIALAASDRTTRQRTAVRQVEFRVIGLSIVAIVAWVALYHWYSLADHFVPDFAFDKIPDHFNSLILQGSVLAFLVITATYVAVFWLLKQTATLSPTLKVIIVLFVACVGLVNIGLYPVGALDVFYYIVQLKLPYVHHVNPYLTTPLQISPGDSANSFAFALGLQLYFGPAWVLVSWIPTTVTGFSDLQTTLVGLKVFNLALLAVTAVLLYKYQDDDKRGWVAVFLFLANPLVLFEGVGNAHNDVMMAFFLVASMLALARGSWLAGPLLALSILVKWFSAGLIPLFIVVILMNRWPRQKALLATLGALAVGVACSLPFWAGGHMMSGLAQGLSSSQDIMRSTSVSSLLREFLDQGGAAPATISLLQTALYGVFGVFALAMLWPVWRGRAYELAANDTFLAFSVLLSLLFPWYLITAFAVIALRRTRSSMGFLIVATTLGLLYHPLSVWAWFNSGLQPIQIHLFQALLLTVPILIFLSMELAGSDMRRATSTRTRPATIARP